VGDAGRSLDDTSEESFRKNGRRGCGASNGRSLVCVAMVCIRTEDSAGQWFELGPLFLQ